jgi:16S rRNA (cytosine967-C5)-methyltransferase
MEHNTTADRALTEIFRRYKLRDERMRGDLARRFYGIIRYWRPLITAIGYDEFESLDQVRELVGVFNAWTKILQGKDPALTGPIVDKLKKYSRVRKLRESLPDWLDTYGVSELGEKPWEELMSALNKDAALFLRTNTLRNTREELIELLRKLGHDAFSQGDLPETIRIKEFTNVFLLDAFREGRFEMQDISSQRVAHFMDLKSGMRVADVCAGKGGKTLHIAALMQNRGKVMAMDFIPRKLEELRTRSTRNGIDVIELMNSNDSSKLEGTFDRVLLDVPCSGTGVLRRNPDIRWRLFEQDMPRLLMQQQEILNTNASLVKTGGKLIYVTCSVFPCEGEKQIEAFILSEKNKIAPIIWEMEEELRTNPISDGGDGFFMARLKKVSC